MGVLELDRDGGVEPEMASLPDAPHPSLTEWALEQVATRNAFARDRHAPPS
jgi:hypothetical protein